MTSKGLAILLFGLFRSSYAFVPSITRTSFAISPGSRHSHLNWQSLVSSSSNGRKNHVMMAEDSTSSTSMGVADSIDMNRYNLAFEMAVNEWTAHYRAPSAMQESGVYLGAKSSKDIFVDTVLVSFPRFPDTRLGLALEEIAGGREDGLGITIVTSVVEDGLSAGSGIIEGDSISAIAIERRKDRKTIVSIDTECLGYDSTVDAIISLPPVEHDDEVFVLTMKRLRRKPRVNLRVQYPPNMNEADTCLELFSGENLRRAMLTRGVKLNDALSKRFDSGGSGDCGAEGTCATCVVSVMKGGELMNPQSIQEQQMLREKPRWRLGCRAIVGYGFQEGEITLRLNPRQWESE